MRGKKYFSAKRPYFTAPDYNFTVRTANAVSETIAGVQNERHNATIIDKTCTCTEIMRHDLGVFWEKMAWWSFKWVFNHNKYTRFINFSFCFFNFNIFRDKYCLVNDLFLSQNKVNYTCSHQGFCVLEYEFRWKELD